jgi:hypothetical protein
MDHDADQFPILTDALREELAIAGYLENCRWFKQEPKDWEEVHELDRQQWRGQAGAHFYRLRELFNA